MRQLNIIGKGDGWDKAPLDGISWGATQLILRRDVNRVVDMNDYSNNRWGETEKLEADISRLRASAMGIPYTDLTNYPLKEIVKKFGTDYFTNTIDFMIALAIYEGFTEIDFYGVNMAHKSEYEYQIPGVSFWCGIAMGRGVKIKFHGNSMIMKSENNLIYGYYTKRK